MKEKSIERLVEVSHTDWINDVVPERIDPMLF